MLFNHFPDIGRQREWHRSIQREKVCRVLIFFLYYFLKVSVAPPSGQTSGFQNQHLSALGVVLRDLHSGTNPVSLALS